MVPWFLPMSRREVMMSKQNNDPKVQSPPEKRNRHWTEGLTIIASIRDTTAILPAGYPLRRATFKQRKEHLLVQAPHHPEILVCRYFADEGLTTLATEDGVEMSRHMVELMSNLSARVETALKALALPGAGEG